jgi:hypothetical protein
MTNFQNRTGATLGVRSDELKTRKKLFYILDRFLAFIEPV